MWDEIDTREHFVEFPTWDWGNGVSKTLSFSEMIQQTNQFSRRLDIACQQVGRAGIIMSAFGHNPGHYWRIPTLVINKLRLVRMRSLLNWLSDSHFPYLRDLFALLQACRNDYAYFTSPGIDWYAEDSFDDAVDEDFESLDFLLDPTPPTAEQKSLLLELHERSDREPSPFDLDLKDKRRVTLSDGIQDGIADMLTSSRFMIPRPLKLGNRSLDFGMYIMALSNWVSEARERLTLDRPILFNPQFEGEESEILRFESQAYLSGSARNEQLPATAALLSDGGDPLMTAIDLRGLRAIEEKNTKSLPAHVDAPAGSERPKPADEFRPYRIDGKHLLIALSPGTASIKLSSRLRETLAPLIEAGIEGLKMNAHPGVPERYSDFIGQIKARLRRAGAPDYIHRPGNDGKGPGAGGVYAIRPALSASGVYGVFWVSI